MNDMEFLTKKDVCALLKISPRTLDLFRARDGLPTVKIGNVCRFRRDAVTEWFLQFQRERGKETA